MFLCRNDELGRLNALYEEGKPQCVAVYGRRRVGKTALINEFTKGKNAIFFPALNTTARDNLIALSRSIQNHMFPGVKNAPVYPSFDTAFDAVDSVARKERLILVIDELQYLARADEEAISSLRKHLEKGWGDTGLFLLLCGSSVGFMEKELHGEHGRLKDFVTSEIRLEPLDYMEASRFTPQLSADDKLLAYAVTGGIPHYLNKLGAGTDLREAIIHNVLDSSSYLFEEPENLLRNELREPAVYNSIISAVANGFTRLGDIAGVTDMESSACSKYISTLIELGVLRKVEPLIGKNRRKTQYRIADNLFRFWYRFVPENMAGIRSGDSARVFDETVGTELNSYMGQPFEEICRQYLMRHQEELPAQITGIGEWWGVLAENNRASKRRSADVHLDIVAVGDDQDSTDRKSTGRKYIIGSCKYSDDPADTYELEHMQRAVSEFTNANDECYYYIFSKSGFSEELNKLAGAGEVSLVSVEDLYAAAR